MDTHDDTLDSTPALPGDGPDAQRPDGGWGAEPSNTAPHKYKPLSLKVLRTAVDSLYLSAEGKLYPKWLEELSVLKEKAQSEEIAERAQAQLKLGGHLFEVKDRGARFYAFILEDNCFQIKLGKGDALLLAYVQVRAEYLAHFGVAGAVADVTRLLNTFAKLKGELVVSRADLAVDFVPPCPMDSWPVRAWITRARDIEPHYHNQVLTGWSIGKRSNMSGRLYDKICEIVQKSHADYLFELWGQRGWNFGEPVWRLEAQFRRDVLEQLGIRSPESLADHLQGLWNYFTQDWLRLAVPTTDHNPSRWPLHPFWVAVSGTSWGQGDQPSLKRFRKQRLPPDERIYPMVMGYLASFMAREQIDDFGEGVGELLRRMRSYVAIEGGRSGKDFEALLDEKVKAKGRLYNTIDNTRTDPKQTAEQAAAYRRAKGIEDANP